MKKTCIMVYGRFNPVHIGHTNIFSTGITIKNSIKDSDLRIFPSTTCDEEKNPLPYDLKVQMIKDYFPECSEYIQSEQGNTLFSTLTTLDPEYDRLILLCGSDRYKHFNNLLTKYNGELYNFDINVMNMGDRNTSPYSSTVMRNAIRNEDFETFKSCLPSVDNNLDMYYFKTIASYMGIKL